jgi:electron transport complex protein RnfG
MLLACVLTLCASLVRAEPQDVPPTNLVLRVLPGCDNRPWQQQKPVVDSQRNWDFLLATQGGRFVGAAVVSSARGYSGQVRVLVGFTATGTVHAVEILNQDETEGVGSRVTEEKFLARFGGRDAARTRWKLRKRGGDIDGITGATISSAAVVAAVAAGSDVYARHLGELRDAAGASQTPPGGPAP